MVDFSKYKSDDISEETLLDMLKDYNLQLLYVIENRQMIIEQLKLCDGKKISVVIIDEK